MPTASQRGALPGVFNYFEPDNNNNYSYIGVPPGQSRHMSNPTPKKPTAFFCTWWPKRYHNTNERLLHDDLLERQTACATQLQALLRGRLGRQEAS